MNFYEILEVTSKASDAEIKAAYRRLALKHHPDQGGDTATFQKIASAYQILSNPRFKQEYDRLQSRNRRSPRSGSRTGSQGTRQPSSIFGPIYESFISKLDTEGVTMGNIDDLVDLLKNAAEETKTNVSNAVNNQSKYEEILDEIFGGHITFGKGR